MEVAVIGYKNIVVAFIYHYGENVNYDCQPIARFIDCFPKLVEEFSSKFLPYIYIDGRKLGFSSVL